MTTRATALRGLTVLVTGASRGIGAATARVLAERGAHLVVHGRDPDRLAALAAELGATAVEGDLTLPGAAADVGRAAVAAAGAVDVLVSCAGSGWAGPVTAMTEGDVERLVRLNLLAPVELTRTLLPAMLDRDCGHLAFVGSVAGLTGVSGECVYSATKAGVLTFADSLRLELRGTGIGVSTLAPAAVETDFWVGRGAAYDRRVPRPVRPEVVAQALVRDIESARPRRVLPGWLAVAPAVRMTTPRLYDRLAGRFG